MKSIFSRRKSKKKVRYFHLLHLSTTNQNNIENYQSIKSNLQLCYFHNADKGYKAKTSNKPKFKASKVRLLRPSSNQKGAENTQK